MSHHHAMRFKIDGHTVKLSHNTHSGAPGWITVFVLGYDLKGRECPVRAIDLPEWFYYRGGKIRTSGYSIELKREGKFYR